MASTLDQLDDMLQRARPGFYARLQPGVSDQQLAEFEQELGVTLPEAFKAFYRWRNGQAIDHYESWQNNQTVMGLAEIRAAHRVLNELLDAGEFEGANWWDAGWVPFLSNGAGDHLCLDTTGSFGGQAGQILEFWHDDGNRWVVAPNFESWLESYLRTFSAVAEYADAGEELEIDWVTDLPGYPLRHAADNG